MLASRWQIYANRATGDREAREVVHILWAIKQAYATNDPWLEGLARKARAYLKQHNVGPRARPAEANKLANYIEHEVTSGSSAHEIARGLLRRLRSLPELCDETVVPISGAWPDADRAVAEGLVTRALELLRASGNIDPELWAKAALNHSDTARQRACTRTERLSLRANTPRAC